MTLYQRRLPHWQPEEETVVTWRLHGSIPPHRYVLPQGLTGGRAFVWMDRNLDEARYGPCWLGQKKVAQLVAEAIHYGERELAHYQLHAHVIMRNAHFIAPPGSARQAVPLAQRFYGTRGQQGAAKNG